MVGRADGGNYHRCSDMFGINNIMQIGGADVGCGGQ